MKQHISNYTSAIIAAIQATHKANRKPAKVEILPLMPMKSAQFRPR